MASTSNSNAQHLCVLIHGLWGNPNHLNHLQDTLRKQYSEDTLHILVAKSNSDNNTYDGIEVGGERIVNEIEQKITDLEENGTKIEKISICGYSLGGLVARYAIGLLYTSGLFDRIEPINFTTFATPHLGIRTPKLGYRSYLYNVMGARTLSTSGQQMFTIDDFRDSGRHLLSIMADPNSVFMKGLSRFKNKWLYANTMNDRSVPFYTAFISRTDPFNDLDKVAVEYLPGQDVILDPSNPVSPQKSPRAEMTLYQRWTSIPQRTINNIPFYVIMFSLIPLFVPAFIANAGYQTYKSARRVQLHESGKEMNLERYRVKLLEEAQAAQDRVFERLEERETEEYLPTPPSEMESSDAQKEDCELGLRESKKEDSPFPILALTKEQFEMIDNLDQLGFTKFPVHIQKVRHTHAAIVVRMDKESFEEGRVVSKHWVERFEV